MSWIETLLPTLDRRMQRHHRWRMSPWWPSESKGCRQRSLLRLLAVAHDQRLDVVPLLNHHAEEQFGIHRSRVRRLARRVSDGTPIVEALEQTPEVVGDDVVLAIRFGAQTGTLSQTYRELIDSHDAVSDMPRLALQHALIYTIVSLLVLGLVLTFLSLFIFPTLLHIQDELGMDQMNTAPMTLSFIVAACNHIANAWPLYVLAALVVVVLVAAGPPRRWLRQWTPRWVGRASESHVAEVLRLLALALEAGRPITAALSTLAHYHFDGSIQYKLLQARNDVEQGGDVWSSLAKVRLLTANESHALAVSSSDASRVWAMRRLAAWKRSQLLHRRDRAASLVQPMITLVLASVVLLISGSVIGFLTYIIWYLA